MPHLYLHILMHIFRHVKKNIIYVGSSKKSLTISKHLSLISKEIIKKTAHEEKTPALLGPDSNKAAY